MKKKKMLTIAALAGTAFLSVTAHASTTPPKNCNGTIVGKATWTAAVKKQAAELQKTNPAAAKALLAKYPTSYSCVPFPKSSATGTVKR